MKRPTRFDRELLNSATRFHGHLGPYLVLGIRMGLLANKILKPNGLHDLSATVYTGQSPPESCLLDGIQLTSGCTIGNGNLRVKNAFQLRARFRKGNRSLLLKPTGATARLLHSVSGRSEHEIEALAVSLGEIPERSLFVVKQDTCR